MSAWLNITEAAEYAGVSRDTMRKWLKDGLSHVRKGNLVKMKNGDIDEYLNKFRHTSSEGKIRSAAEKVCRGLGL